MGLVPKAELIPQCSTSRNRMYSQMLSKTAVDRGFYMTHRGVTLEPRFMAVLCTAVTENRAVDDDNRGFLCSDC